MLLRLYNGTSIRFQANFGLNKILLNFLTFCGKHGKCSVIQILQFGRFHYFVNDTIFHSFEVENCISNYNIFK